MKRLFYILLFLPTLLNAQVMRIPLNDFSGGLMTKFSKDRIPINFSPDLLNVRLDTELGIVKRTGYQKYNTTALTGARSIRKMYNYKQSDGDEYIIVNSSSSVFQSIGGGSYSSIVAQLSSSYDDSYATALDYLYRDNGSDTPGKWDGTTYTELTVLNSTDIVSGKYQAFHYNCLFKAGVSGYLSRLYWSLSNYPDDFGSYGSGDKEVGKNDGDIVTGLLKVGPSLLITKQDSTHQLVGSDPQTWLVSVLDPRVGCLYASTMDLYKGSPIWLSRRGVELWNGSNFQLISEPIDNEIKALPQMVVGQNVWVQDTAVDWGEGICNNVSTTTCGGSVTIDTLKQLDQSGSGTYLNSADAGIRHIRQRIFPEIDFRCEWLVLGLHGTEAHGSDDYLRFDFLDASYTTLYSSVIASSSLFPGTSTYPLNIGVDLVKDNTYYMLVSTEAGTNSLGGWRYSAQSVPDGPIKWGWGEQYFSYTWHLLYGFDLMFLMYDDDGQYISQTHNAGTNWATWGDFNVSDTKPSGSDITYFVRASTASDNITTKTFVSVTDGNPINTTVGPYIQVISSFTRTDKSVEPKLTSFIINYYTSAENPPVGITYEDNYYLFVSTDSSTKINNVCYVYDKYGRWTKFNNIYTGGACINRNTLYTGSSDSNGFTYKMFVDDLYTDDGGSYNSHYTTPVMDFGDGYIEKDFKERWIYASNSGATIGFDYRVNNSTGSWTTQDVPLTTNNMPTIRKIPYDATTRAYLMQLRFTNNTGGEWFNIKGATINFDPYPLQ